VHGSNARLQIARLYARLTGRQVPFSALIQALCSVVGRRSCRSRLNHFERRFAQCDADGASGTRRALYLPRDKGVCECMFERLWRDQRGALMKYKCSNVLRAAAAAPRQIAAEARRRTTSASTVISPT
jgi:hypothetical protein